MPSQPEERQTSRPEDENGANSDAVRTRVSELLDNATVAPDDDLGRDELARSGVAGDESEPGEDQAFDEPAGQSSEVSADTAAATATDGAGPVGATPALNGAADEQPDDAAVAGDGGDADLPAIESVEEAAPAGEAIDPVASGSPESLADGSPSGDGATEAETDAAAAAGAELDGGDQVDTPSARSGDDGVPATTVRIRGRPGGVLVEIDDVGEWKEILALLEERLAAAEGFFRGGKAVIEVGPRDVYEDELRQARDTLARHDMTLAVVRSTSDLTLQSSLLLGLSTSSEGDRPAEPDRDMAAVVPITQPKSPYFVHNGTLRSGQILRKSESIMIVGDVNPGAKVISAGDVMVWGRLRGMAYAGATGNNDARVAAIEFAPTQLRIASVTAVPPDPPKSRGLRFWKKRQPERRPEVAHVSDGRIVVEPWDDSRPGRPKSSRR